MHVFVLQAISRRKLADYGYEIQTRCVL